MPAAAHSLPLILFEDEHLLVVNKPAGWNTHSPAPFAGEGIHDWLKHREPRWASLAIIHRLDKETSGLMVFGRSPLANRSLTEQFANRTVKKQYLLLTDREVTHQALTVKGTLVRTGEKYVNRPVHAGGELAETRFRIVNTDSARRTLMEAEPLTGRTHQIRVHAADNGFPIIGDELYGGAASQRMCLHAARLTFTHPADGTMQSFEAPVDFRHNARDALRQAFIEPALTDAYRLRHGAGDGRQFNGRYVDRLGDYLLFSVDGELGSLELALEGWRKKFGSSSIYQKRLDRAIGKTSSPESSPQLLIGEPAPDRFIIRENGVKFELSFKEGYSVGLFLDQRDNRRRFLVNHVAAGFPLFETASGGREVLNAFAYTCGFSVCAARAGARVTSLDLSKKYLEWGQHNFTLNQIAPGDHDFIVGDVFDWLRRFTRKGRAFDAVILDPPTFSRSKDYGVFQAEKDFEELVRATLPVLKPRGILLASTNAASLKPEKFLATVTQTIHEAGRRAVQQHYVPQPPDFPITREEPAYLKTLWVRAG